MKIFITGATGFIGKQVLNLLCQNKDHELVCLVRKLNDASECLKNLGANLIIGDIMDKESIRRAIKGCTHGIHLAALYSLWEKDNRLYEKINVEGTRNVMECALEANLKKIVHVSSAVVFGRCQESPYNEDSPMGPCFSEYAKSKRRSDQITLDLHKNKGLPVVIIYPGCVLGAGDPKASGDYVSNIIHKRMPATVFNNSMFPWVYVGDVAEGIILALEKPDNIGDRYLISKHNLTFGEFNRKVSELSGVPLPSMSMPDSMALAGSFVITGFSKILKVKPALGMAWDQMKIMKYGMNVDGSKAERELGLQYTPIETAIEEEVATLR